MKRKPLGQMLVQRGLIPPVKLKEALQLQANTGNRLGTECLERGFTTEAQLLSTLSAQVGVPGVELSKLVLPLRFLDVVPEQIAKKHGALPVRVDGERVFLAMVDPGNEELISEIAFTSNRKLLACVALKGPLQRTINTAYAAKARGELVHRGELADGLDPSTEGAMSLVSAEELAQVPVELIESIDARPSTKDSVAAPAPVEDTPDLVIAPELDPRDDQSVEVMVDDDPANSDPEVDAKGTQVLLVDDDPEIRRLVTRLLTSRGMRVEEACRGLEALASIKRSPPDLILLDAMLPEVHGFDICRKIKRSDRYGAIPVIMISSIYRGWRFAQDLKDTYGVDAFLEKPFELDALWNTVERVLAGVKRRPRKTRPMSTNAKKALRTGVKRYKGGDLDGAIESFKEGIHVDPLSAKLHHQLAILYLKKKGMTYQAMQEFEEALALDPEIFSALRNLAILYQSKGFKNKAIDMWERALRISPNDETREHIRKHLLSLL